MKTVSPGRPPRREPRQSLAERFAELEVLYRTAPIGLCLMDRQLRFVRINERLAEINGRPAADHIGRTIRDLLPTLADQVEPLYRKVIDTGEAIHDYELSGPTPADPEREKQWLVNYSPLKADDGQVLAIHTVVQEITELRKAHTTVELSEERYRALVEHAPDAIVVLDVETGKFVDFNQNALDLFGLDRDTILTVGPTDVSPPVQPDGRATEEVSADNRAQAISGRQLTFHWIHRHSDGHDIPCEVRLVRLPAGDRILLRGSILDISERKRAERAMRESELRYRTLVEYSADAICVVDSDSGLFVDVNENASKLFGLSRSKLLTVGPGEISPPLQPNGRPSEEMVRVRLADAVREGLVTFEWTHRHADGTIIPCEIRLTPYPMEGRRLFRGSITDITERQRVEMARRKTEERLRLLLETTNAIPWEADPRTWQFIYVGPQAEKILGYPVAEWYGKDFWPVHIHPDDRDAAIAYCQRSTRKCDDHTFDYRMIDAAGQIVWIHDLVTVESRDGRPVLLRGIMVDITARKRAELLQTGQKRVLERLARGEPLVEVLGELARTIDAQQTGMMCSILLLDETGKRLRAVAAPQLPGLFVNAIDGLTIGPDKGGCGTAAYRGERVIITDLATDPLCVEFRELALSCGLRSCWSQPIKSQSGDVLGTIAIHHRRPSNPGAAELELIEQAANIAGVAIERRRAVEALRASEIALQNLAGKLIFAQEEERRRLARELHDDLTQRLAVLAIEAGKLHALPATDRLKDGLSRLRDEIVGLCEDVHGMSRQIHPSIIDDLGLVDAIASECGRFSEREGIPVRFRPENTSLCFPREISVCLYRVVQEGLRNIAKHSNAKQASIDLVVENGEVRLAIRDNGVGFDSDRSRRRAGLGLASMEERIRLVNGDLVVRSRSGEGAVVEVRAPLPKPAEAGPGADRTPARAVRAVARRSGSRSPSRRPGAPRVT